MYFLNDDAQRGTRQEGSEREGNEKAEQQHSRHRRKRLLLINPLISLSSRWRKWGGKDHIKKEFLNYGPPREKICNRETQVEGRAVEAKGGPLDRKSIRQASYHGLSRSWSEMPAPCLQCYL